MKKTIRIALLLILICSLYYYWPTKPTAVQMAKLISMTQGTDIENKEHAVLIDYSKPLTSKRLWLINLKTKEVLLNCHVSHAKKSGLLWPTTFSNKVGSEFSCSGRFKTLNTYVSNYGKGQYKVGLRLDGLDDNNSHTLERNIVFHSFWPLWSKGCFMTTQANNKFIIDNLKKGSLVLVLR